jgi:hypothetical protein
MSKFFHFVAAALLAAGAVASLAGLAAAAQTPGASTLLGADLCQKALCFVAFF